MNVAEPEADIDRLLLLLRLEKGLKSLQTGPEFNTPGSWISSVPTQLPIVWTDLGAADALSSALGFVSDKPNNNCTSQ